MNETFDLIIIGGGPGGYVAAIRASQLGLKTALVEKRPTLGGTCANVGCIPTKALLDSTEKYNMIRHNLSDHGISAKDIAIDIKKMMERKEKIVRELTDGIKFLFKKNKITLFQGTGSLHKAESGGVEVLVEPNVGGVGDGDGAEKKSGEAQTVIASRYCLIATGSEPMSIPGIEMDGEIIITSDEALSMPEIPEHLLIIGGGVIGLELGSVWARLGSKITVVEMLPRLLPPIDPPLAQAAAKIFEKEGFTFHFNTKVISVKKKKKTAEVEVEYGSGERKTITCDRVLVAAGRRPVTGGLGLERAGIRLNGRGRIEVDPVTLHTSCSSVYAVGDVIEGPMLAHKAEEEGLMVAENLAGKKGHVNYDTIPGVVYTHPEIAWVGRSEEMLKKEGIEYNTGKFFFKANGRAKTTGETDGQIKILADKKTDRIYGVFILGPGASEMIAEAVLAMEFGASAEDIARTCHAHPTLSEALKEAALDVDGRAIHS